MGIRVTGIGVTGVGIGAIEVRTGADGLGLGTETDGLRTGTDGLGIGADGLGTGAIAWAMLTDFTDPGLLLGTKVISLAPDIQPRGGNFSVSPAPAARSSAPLSNKSAIVHSDEMFFEGEEEGEREGGA